MESPRKAIFSPFFTTISPASALFPVVVMHKAMMMTWADNLMKELLVGFDIVISCLVVW
jgi:hypothetical protein